LFRGGLSEGARTHQMFGCDSYAELRLAKAREP
jgi:hypothetical protein